MRRIPDDNLAYAALVRAGSSIGTGFFLNCPSVTYLVTARHVIIDPKSDEFHSPSLHVTARPARPAPAPNEFTFDLNALASSNRLRSNTSRDVATIELARGANGDFDFVDGVQTVRPMTVPNVGVAVQSLVPLSDVLVGNDVYIFGYPVSLGLPNIPQLDYSRPLLRAGIIAGINDALQTIILDCPVYPGNSGGPALQVSQEGNLTTYRVFGVVTQFVPTTARILGAATSGAAIVNSGYSVVSAIDSVLALVDCSG